MEKNEIEYFDLYKNKKMKVNFPHCSKYDFLLENNKNYMDYIALSNESGKKVTFEELHTRINEYARALYHKGIRKGEVVGVCLTNTIESVYLLYALDIIGAIVVGLSLFNNKYKMQRDIEIAEVDRIISLDLMYENIKDALYVSPILYSHQKNNLIPEDQDLEKIIEYGKNSELVKGDYQLNQLTDILFTGGSTGTHKGVELSSDGLNYVALAQGLVWPLEPGMIHLGNIPFGHMVFGRSVLHYSLCNNLEYAITLNAMPDKFYDELVRTGANGAMGGPIHWETLINNPKVKKGSLKNLIQATSGGEMLKAKKREEIIDALKFAGSDAILGDGLGITEMWAPTHINVGGKNTPGTVGYPLPLAEAKVVNPNELENRDISDNIILQEVPIGQVGILLVRSPGMMLGYHNNPSETEKVFVYDQNGIKWYNTGDLVMRCGINNNEFKFAGRKKRNFVCGVDNVYPEQIEALLLQFSEIKEAIITPIPDDKYQFIPSYHISLQNENIDKIQLKNKIDVLIESTLGSSALPGYIEFTVEPLKRNERNKLDINYYKEEDQKKLEENSLNLIRKIY